MSEPEQAQDSRLTWQLLLLIQLALAWYAAVIALWVTERILAGWCLWGGVVIGLVAVKLARAANLARPKGADS